MSIARPDSSRRREPHGPGRRFGPCTENRHYNKDRRTRAWIALVVGVLACHSLVAIPAIAENDAGPIVLNNDDVTRLHGQQTSASPLGDDAARREPALADTTTAPTAEELAEAMALNADLRARLERISQRSMSSVEKALEARSFSEPSGPTRAQVAARSKTSMPAAPLPRAPGAEDPASDGSDAGASENVGAPEPACIYGPHGHLLFEPKGRSCDAIREQRARPNSTDHSKRAAEPKDASVRCVYGSRGQLLYESRGVECAETSSD